MTTIHTRLMFNDVALFVYSYPRRCPSVFLFLLLVQQRAILYMYVVQAAVGDDHVSSCLLGTNNGLIAKKKSQVLRGCICSSLISVLLFLPRLSFLYSW